MGDQAEIACEQKHNVLDQYAQALAELEAAVYALRKTHQHSENEDKNDTRGGNKRLFFRYVHNLEYSAVCESAKGEKHAGVYYPLFKYVFEIHDISDPFGSVPN